MELNTIQESAIKEISNIGLGHAVGALTSLTGKDFNMSVPDARSMELSEVLDAVGGPEGLAVGVLMPIDGDLTGHMALLFPWEAAENLWQLLLCQSPKDVSEIDELYASGVIEVGNIINSSFLNAISEMTGYKLHATPPVMAVDSAASILGAMVCVADYSGGVALTIKTRIFNEESTFDGIFLYVPNEESLSKLFSVLGLGEVA